MSGLPTLLAIYFVVWWVVLFTVLPMGTRSHHEEEQAVPGGGDPGSPSGFSLKRKLWTTTWVAAIVFGLVVIALRLFWPTLQPLDV